MNPTDEQMEKFPAIVARLDEICAELEAIQYDDIAESIYKVVDKWTRCPKSGIREVPFGL